MSAAWASEGAAGGGGAEAFYMSAEFWVLVAFIILISAIGKTAYFKLVGALDMRAQDIKEQIEDAVKLREEAQEMLASFERKQHDAANEAKEIVARAETEAARLAEHAAGELEKSLKRREELALERISQAENKAVGEVRALAVDVAISATQQLLADKASGKKTAALIDDAIEELPEKLN